MFLSLFSSKKVPVLHFMDPECSECDKSSFYDLTCYTKETLDKFSPLEKKRIVSSRPFAPWINIFVRGQKQVKRQTERLYRKTGLTIHKYIFKFQKHNTIKMAKEEKRNIHLTKKNPLIIHSRSFLKFSMTHYLTTTQKMNFQTISISFSLERSRK